MTTFKMYVKTVIYNDQDKLLLLNEKREDNKPCWDLPGATFTEEQSFDETIINNVQKEIGYYVYPGKIIGISDYMNKKEKEVNVIMEGTILNGDLLLSKAYETHTWVSLDRITDYPLAPWLKDYIKNNKNPFKDVETEIEEITNKSHRRRNLFHEDRQNNKNTSGNNTETINGSVKSSFSILKDTIIRTFHPQKAQVSQTQPKANQIYEESPIQDTEESSNQDTEEKESFVNKLNFKFKRDKEDYINEELMKDSADDIIIEHDNDIIIEHDNDIIIEDDDNDIIIEDENKNIKPDNDSEDIIIKDPIPERKNIPKKDNIQKFISNNKKVFDMNINRSHNMKNNVNKIKKVIKEKRPKKEPQIKIIHKNEKTPRIRTEKESAEKVSFNSENFRSGWKERLNQMNRTEANNKRKEAPRPKGQRK